MQYEERPAVTVVDIKLPFGSMVVFMLKRVFATIPAMILAWLILTGLALVVVMALGGLGHLIELGRQRRQ